jgi:hypothetical protein
LERSSQYLSASRLDTGGYWNFGRVAIPIGVEVKQRMAAEKWGVGVWGNLNLAVVPDGRFNELHTLSPENGFNGQAFHKNAWSGIVGLEVQAPAYGGAWTPRIQAGFGGESATIRSTYLVVAEGEAPETAQPLDYTGHWRAGLLHLGLSLPIWSGLSLRLATQRTTYGEVVRADVLGTRNDNEGAGSMAGWDLDHYRWLADVGWTLGKK